MRMRAIAAPASALTNRQGSGAPRRSRIDCAKGRQDLVGGASCSPARGEIQRSPTPRLAPEWVVGLAVIDMNPTSDEIDEAIAEEAATVRGSFEERDRRKGQGS
jgi:hypothetical protein